MKNLVEFRSSEDSKIPDPSQNIITQLCWQTADSAVQNTRKSNRCP